MKMLVVIAGILVLGNQAALAPFWGAYSSEAQFSSTVAQGSGVSSTLIKEPMEPFSGSEPGSTKSTLAVELIKSTKTAAATFEAGTTETFRVTGNENTKQTSRVNSRGNLNQTQRNTDGELSTQSILGKIVTKNAKVTDEESLTETITDKLKSTHTPRHSVLVGSTQISIATQILTNELNGTQTPVATVEVKSTQTPRPTIKEKLSTKTAPWATIITGHSDGDLGKLLTEEQRHTVTHRVPIETKNTVTKDLRTTTTFGRTAIVVLPDILEDCGNYHVIQVNLKCRAQVSGDYKFVKRNKAGTKATYVKLDSSYPFNDYKIFLIQTTQRWEIKVAGDVVAYTDPSKTGTLCFAGKTIWNVICSNGEELKTVLDTEVQSTEDPLIVVVSYSYQPLGDMCVPEYDTFELNIDDKSVLSSETCAEEVEGAYDYMGGTYGGAKMYEKRTLVGEISLHFSPYAKTAAIGSTVNIALHRAVSMLSSTDAYCPDTINKIAMFCNNEFVMADCTLKGQLKGAVTRKNLYTSLAQVPKPSPYKNELDLYTYDPLEDSNNWITPSIKAVSTPIFPVTGEDNHRMCKYFKFVIENFGGNCGIMVNGDYTITGDISSGHPVYEKLTPITEMHGGKSLYQKYYIYYIGTYHRWVIGTGFLDGKGLLASLKYPGECLYSKRAEKKWMFEEDGGCYGDSKDEKTFPIISPLPITVNNDAMFTMPKLKLSINGISKRGKPVEFPSGCDYSAFSGIFTKLFQQTLFSSNYIYVMQDDMSLTGNTKIKPTIKPLKYIWYSPANKAWIINDEIGFVKSNKGSDLLETAQMIYGKIDMFNHDPENEPWEDFNPSIGEFNQPMGGFNQPMGGFIQPMRGFNQPMGTNPPMGEMNPPMGNFNPPMGDFNPPMGKMNPPMGNFIPPMGEINQPRQGMNLPMGVNPPSVDYASTEEARGKFWTKLTWVYVCGGETGVLDLSFEPYVENKTTPGLINPGNITEVELIPGPASIKQGEWIVPKRGNRIEFDLQNTSLQVKTNSILGSDDEVVMSLWFEDGTFTVIEWSFSNYEYYILHCTGSYQSTLPRLTSVPSTVDKVWTLTKSETTLILTCNGVTVLKFVYKEAQDPSCFEECRLCASQMSKKVNEIEFKVDSDSASDGYRATSGTNSIFGLLGVIDGKEDIADRLLTNKVVITTQMPISGTTLPSSFFNKDDPIFQAVHMLLQTRMVFSGRYCRTAAERNSAKFSFQEWDLLMKGSCYINTSCRISKSSCNYNTDNTFSLKVTFKERIIYSYDNDHKTPGLTALQSTINTFTKMHQFEVRTASSKRSTNNFMLKESTTLMSPKCPAGSIQRDLTLCVWCDVGTFEQEGVCVECQIDMYQDKKGETTCIPCAYGYGTNTETGQSTCVNMSIIKEVEAVVKGLSTVVLAVIAGGGGFLVIIVICITVCVMKIKAKNANKVRRINITSGKVSHYGHENEGYLNSRTNVLHN